MHRLIEIHSWFAYMTYPLIYIHGYVHAMQIVSGLACYHVFDTC